MPRTAHPCTTKCIPPPHPKSTRLLIVEAKLHTPLPLRVAVHVGLELLVLDGVAVAEQARVKEPVHVPVAGAGGAHNDKDALHDAFFLPLRD